MNGTRSPFTAPSSNARAAVMLVALGLVLVVALLIAVVSVSRWTYTELRNQANGTSADREAIPGPAVIGPATPAPSSRSRAPTTTIGPGGPPRGTERGPSLAIPVDGVAPGELYPSFADARGDRIGYVGSTGNASDDAPHLHFAVFVLGPEKRWWAGRPIDPYPLLGGKN